MAQIKAPWSQTQVLWLNQFQTCGAMHPFTCGTDSRHEPLVAGPNGWVCIDCGFTQDWAHDFMADPKAVKALQKSAREMRKQLKTLKD